MEALAEADEAKPQIPEPRPEKVGTVSGLAGKKRPFEDFDVDFFGTGNFEPTIKRREHAHSMGTRERVFPGQATLKRESTLFRSGRVHHFQPKEEARELGTEKAPTSPKRVGQPRRTEPFGEFQIDLKDFKAEKHAEKELIELILDKVKRNLEGLAQLKVRPGINRFNLQVRVEPKNWHRNKFEKSRAGLRTSFGEWKTVDKESRRAQIGSGTRGLEKRKGTLRRLLGKNSRVGPREHEIQKQRLPPSQLEATGKCRKLRKLKYSVQNRKDSKK